MNIIIVGAGVTGLAAAISLRRAGSGHRITIYERSSMTNEVGAAINVPPNVGRFLLKWGLDPIKSRFVSTTGMYFMSHETLSLLPGPAAVFDHSRNTELYGAPLYYAHRVDLLDALRRLATDPDSHPSSPPVTIYLKSEVVSYNPSTPNITLSDGRTLQADLVIAADGIHSTAVQHVLGGHANPASVPKTGTQGNVCYRFLIPRVDVDSDPDTKWFNDTPLALGCRIWVDIPNRKRLLQYPCRDHETLNFVAIMRDDDYTLAQRKEDWLAPVDTAELLQKYSNFNKGLLNVIAKARDVKRWPLLYRPPIGKWHTTGGGLVLAGDAAHPMLPHHAQAGAQGIEDGLALGLVLHGVSDKSEIEHHLKLYEKIRRNRASAIQVMSNFGFDEKMPDEVVEFLEGWEIPKTPSEMLKIAYTPDVVGRTVQTMMEFDSSWKLPEGFFVNVPKPSGGDALS
ncbi:FAD/NAD(P)-binding domain-containing protein [Apodospora peruviana]|uniref:FAD/NAD(P)-binding domain-containing protein n=1 Tax=Apodospora peruviana TaxID=516989 RepID=A0AAE0M2Q6_9PEZI|nr:FAD/NAD(P)-binding domain-containing protein [Apodospora peruviana]